MDYSKIGKRWEPRNGQARYYVNNWQSLIGMHVDYYKTGNVASVYLDGGEAEISNSHYKKYIADTKVWIGEEDGQIHIDYCENSIIRKLIERAVGELVGDVQMDEETARMEHELDDYLGAVE